MDEVGFIGLGIMGRPMASNLVRAGFPVVVWNRTRQRCRPLAELGAVVAQDPAEVFSRCRTVVLMLADEAAVDQVLDRGGPGFAAMLAGRTVVQTGTLAPDYSAALGAAVEAAGGAYVEAPVSGSRGPAEAGTLVAMLAGPPEAVASAIPVVEAMCASHFECGAVPGALMTKLAVNIFLITTVTGLAEAFAFAEAGGLDPGTVRAVLDAGPMASQVSRGKTAKLAEGDLAPQAALADVHKNTVLIDQAAAREGATVPLLRECRSLYQRAVDLGLGGQDMIAVVRALTERRARPATGPE